MECGMKKQVIERFYLRMHVRSVGKIDPTSLSGPILVMRLRERMSFIFCFIHLYILDFVTDISYFHKNGNKEDPFHFRKNKNKKQCPGHGLFQWHFLAFLVCHNCSQIDHPLPHVLHSLILPHLLHPNPGQVWRFKPFGCYDTSLNLHPQGSRDQQRTVSSC